MLATAEDTAPAGRAVVYVRVSSVGGRDTGSASYQTEAVQQERCEAYAVARGYDVVEVVTDTDVSGGKWDRRGLNHVLGLVDGGKVDAVIVYRLSRLGRGLKGVLATVERLQAAGVGLMSVSEGIDLTTASGRMLFNVMASFDQYEREIRGEYWRDTKARATARGVLVGPTPYGYDRVKGGAESGKLTPASSAEHVAAAFRLRAGGASYVKIAEYLDEHDPRPGGRVWHNAQIRRMLASRVYVGEVTRSGDTITGAHPPLVSEDEWRAAQDVRTRAPSSVTAKYAFRLAGVLRCAGCGRPMSGNTRTSPHKPQYICQRRSSLRACEAPASIQADRAEHYVLSVLGLALERVQLRGDVPTDGVDLAALDRAVDDAERAVDAVATDPGLRAAMGEETWRRSLKEHAAVRDAAVEAARVARARQRVTDVATIPVSEILGDSALTRAALDAYVLDARVARGKGMTPAERITVTLSDVLDAPDPLRVLTGDGVG